MASKARSRSFDHEFKPLSLSKKSATMVVPPSYMKLSDLNYPSKAPLKYNDVLFRKHFESGNQFPTLTKQNSFRNHSGVWVCPQVAPPPAPQTTKASHPDKLPRAIVVVDCFSTGAMVAHDALERGYKTINVSSFDNPDLAEMIPSNCRSDYDVSFTFQGSNDDVSLGNDDKLQLKSLVERLAGLPYTVECIIAGAETGCR